MSSDDAYASFLDKANEDTGYSAQSNAQSSTPKTRSASAKASTSGSSAHPALQSVDAYYTSDTDEPFEPVSFPYEGSETELSESDFASLLDFDADVTTMSAKEFDPKGEYKSVLEAVGKAGSGKTMIFRVDLEGTRIEYYVVTMDKKHGSVVGLRAMAVES